MEIEEPQPFTLAEQMPQYADLWDEIVAEYDLEPTPWATLVDRNFGDAILGSTSGVAATAERVLTQLMSDGSAPGLS